MTKKPYYTRQEKTLQRIWVVDVASVKYHQQFRERFTQNDTKIYSTPATKPRRNWHIGHIHPRLQYQLGAYAHLYVKSTSYQPGPSVAGSQRLSG